MSAYWFGDDSKRSTLSRTDTESDLIASAEAAPPSRRDLSDVLRRGCRFKRDAAGQHRGKRLGPKLQTVGPERKVDGAGIPEARGAGDQPIIRCVDEHHDLCAMATGLELSVNHVPDLEVPEIHRRINCPSGLPIADLLLRNCRRYRGCAAVSGCIPARQWPNRREPRQRI
jgi:hypothetical protein